MKMIEAFVRSFLQEKLKDSLNEIGVTGMTATEIRKGIDDEETPEGDEHLLPMLKIQICVPDDLVECVVGVIVNIARTHGRKKDNGLVLVYTVERAIRIRTEEEGDESIS